MKIRSILSFLILITLAFPALAQEEPARKKMFGAETITLENGLQVIAISNPRAPVVTHMVWYKVGAADEAEGKTGLAHFLEHLMFKGSEHVPPGELSKIVKKMGGNDNAFTTQDYTAYFQNISSKNLRKVMEMEADRMRGILLPEDEFESEQRVVLEERRQNIENDPRSYFIEQMRYALYPGHPYGRPTIGWKQDIEKLTRDDALDFYKKWYAPNNAILIVAGDITIADLRPLAEEIYGPIPRKDVTPSSFPGVAGFAGQPRFILRDPQMRQPMVIWLARAPGFAQNKTDSMALQVLMEIMSGSPATRLYRSLVVEQKLAIGANMGYQDAARNTGSVSASLLPAEGVTLEALEEAFIAEIRKVANDGVTDTELQEAKMRMKDSADFARDSLSGPARAIGEGLSVGMSLDDIEYWPYAIDEVSTAQVKDVAVKYLLANLDKAVAGQIIPPPPAPTQTEEKRP